MLQTRHGVSKYVPCLCHGTMQTLTSALFKGKLMKHQISSFFRVSILSCLSCLFLFLAVPVASSAEEKGCPECICRIDGSVVTIDIYNVKGALIRQAGGFVISDKGEILSASSRFVGSHSARVKTPSGRTFSVKGTLGENRKKGIVKIVLNSKDESVPAVSLAKKRAAAGEEVVIKNPWSETGRYLRGRLEPLGRMFKVVVDAPLPGELIGSPVFNLKGDVVGVVNSLRKGAGEFYAVSLSEETAPESSRFMTLLEWQEKRNKDCIETPELLRYSVFHLISLGRYENAVSTLDKLIKKMPEDAEAYAKKGYCCSKLGKYQKALNAYKKSAELKPDNGLSQYDLGIAYAMLDRYQEAAGAYRKAVKLAPKNPKIHYNLAIAYLAMENIKAAEAEYEVLKALDEKLSKRLAKAIERVTNRRVGKQGQPLCLPGKH